MINNGAIPHFVNLVVSPDPQVAEQAVWALGNIAGDSPSCRDIVLKAGGLDKIIQLQRNCMRALQQRANDFGWRFEHCLADEQCLQLINLLRNMTWTLSNCCRGKPQPDMKYLCIAIEALSILLTIPDSEIKRDACWAFSYISDDDIDTNQENAKTEDKILGLLEDQGLDAENKKDNKDNKDSKDSKTGKDKNKEKEKGKMENTMNAKVIRMHEVGALDRLINDCLGHTDAKVKHPAIRVLGNIVTGCDEQTDLVLNLGLLSRIIPLVNTDSAIRTLTRSREQVRREACWMLSNIAAGTDNQISKMVDCGVFTKLIELLKREDISVPFETKKEIAWVFGNATRYNNWRLVWNIERIIWIGHLENDNNNKCYLSNININGNKFQFPKHLVTYVLSFLNSNFDKHYKEKDMNFYHEWKNNRMSQIRYIVDQGVIAPLCNLLDCENQNIKNNFKFLLVVMESLDHILQWGHDLKKFKNLPANEYVSVVEASHGFEKVWLSFFFVVFFFHFIFAVCSFLVFFVFCPPLYLSLRESCFIFVVALLFAYRFVYFIFAFWLFLLFCIVAIDSVSKR